MKYLNFSVACVVYIAASICSGHRVSTAQDIGRVNRNKTVNPALYAKIEELWKRRDFLVKAGHAAEKAGNLPEAEDQYRKAAQVTSPDGEILLSLVHVLQQEKKNTEAIQVWRKIIYSQGWAGSLNSDTRVRMEYILSLLDTPDMNGSNWREAVALYDTARQNGPPSSELPDVFDPARRDYAQMRTRAHLVLSHDYHHGPVSREEKLRHLESAVRDLPPTPKNLLKLGIALDQAGRIEEAQSTFHRAQALTSTGPIDKDTKLLLSHYLYAADYKMDRKNRLAKLAMKEKLAKTAAH